MLAVLSTPFDLGTQTVPPGVLRPVVGVALRGKMQQSDAESCAVARASVHFGTPRTHKFPQSGINVNGRKMDCGWILHGLLLTPAPSSVECLARSQFRFDILGDVVGNLPLRRKSVADLCFVCLGP